MGDPTRAPGIGRLKRRADFVRVAKGRRWHGKAMTLQAAATLIPGDAARVGFTLTRKVGNAVVRNRARRRLKEALRLEALRLAADLPVEAGRDYVILGRTDAVGLPFLRLQSELVGAFRALRTSERRRNRPAPNNTETP